MFVALSNLTGQIQHVALSPLFRLRTRGHIRSAIKGFHPTSAVVATGRELSIISEALAQFFNTEQFIASMNAQKERCDDRFR
jgi:hypothetical protein